MDTRVWARPVLGPFLFQSRFHTRALPTPACWGPVSSPEGGAVQGPVHSFPKPADEHFQNFLGGRAVSRPAGTGHSRPGVGTGGRDAEGTRAQLQLSKMQLSEKNEQTATVYVTFQRG